MPAFKQFFEWTQNWFGGWFGGALITIDYKGLTVYWALGKDNVKTEITKVGDQIRWCHGVTVLFLQIKLYNNILRIIISTKMFYYIFLYLHTNAIYRLSVSSFYLFLSFSGLFK